MGDLSSAVDVCPGYHGAGAELNRTKQDQMQQGRSRGRSIVQGLPASPALGSKCVGVCLLHVHTQITVSLNYRVFDDQITTPAPTYHKGFRKIVLEKLREYKM